MRLGRLKNRIIRSLSNVRLAVSRPAHTHQFFIASAAYNAEAHVEKHMRSIHGQRYPLDKVCHVILDDGSTDATEAVVRAYMQRGDAAHLSFQKNSIRVGGCANLTRLFRSAPPGSIVLQVDADDWLADERVLSHLNWLYQDPDLWMTYNSWQFPDGRPSANSQRIPARVVRENSYRSHIWISSHLHSFRRELFDHVKEESLIDPETGEYFRSAVDMCHYFPMLELSARHARHVERVLYTYNMHAGSIIVSTREAQLACESRIRRLPRYQPLSKLAGGAAAE